LLTENNQSKILFLLHIGIWTSRPLTNFETLIKGSTVCRANELDTAKKRHHKSTEKEVEEFCYEYFENDTGLENFVLAKTY